MMSFIYQSRVNPSLRSDSLTFSAKDCVVEVDASKFDVSSIAGGEFGYPKAFPLTPEIRTQSEEIQKSMPGADTDRR